MMGLFAKIVPIGILLAAAASADTLGGIYQSDLIAVPEARLSFETVGQTGAPIDDIAALNAFSLVLSAADTRAAVQQSAADATVSDGASAQGDSAEPYLGKAAPPPGKHPSGNWVLAVCAFIAMGFVMRRPRRPETNLIARN